jgi:hypothetical protein
VTGDGVNMSLGGNGSGGTIQNTTGAGISLNNTDDVSLNYMNITNAGTDSIRITDINGFTLNRSNISDSAGTAPADKAIDIGDFVTGTPVSGTINITNSIIGPAAGSSPHDSIAIGISTGTSTWNVTGNTIRRTGNSGINMELRGNSIVTAFMVDNVSFAGANTAGGTGSPSARGIFANTLDDSVMTLFTIQNSSFTNNNIHIDLNQQNDTDPVGSHTFKVLNNATMTGARSHAMNIFAAAGSFGGQFTGTVQGNTIGNASIDGSGSEIGNGIRVNVNGGTDAAMLIHDNDIFETPNGRGIEVIGRNGLGTLDITITNNAVDHYNLTYPIGGGAAAFPLGAIYVNAAKGGAAGIVGFRVRSDVRLNTVPTAGGPLPAASEVTGTYLALVESVGSETGGILELVDTAPASANATAQLQSTNTGDAGANAGVSLIAGPIDVPPPLLATSIGSGHGTNLTDTELSSVVAAAIDRLATAGASNAQLAILNSVSFQIVDLAGAQLGSAGAGVVQIDINGAGWGYFVDDSPYDDSEFAILAAGGGLQADEDSAAFGRIDVLTVVLHELGHILGYDHGDEDGLLGATLETGVRHTDLDALFADEEALAAVLLG